jgi:anti-sigma-K factor RskA
MNESDLNNSNLNGADPNGAGPNSAELHESELHDLIPLHALGALEPEQVPLIEAYLAANPEAQASYVWYLEAVSILARSLPLQEPPVGLKARMLNRVRDLQSGKPETAKSVQVESVRAGSVQVESIQTESVQTAVPSISSDRTVDRTVDRASNRSRPRSVRAGGRKSRWPVALGITGALTAGLGISAIVGLTLRNNDLSQQLLRLEDSQRSLESFLNSSSSKIVALNATNGKTSVGLALIGTDGRVLINHTMGKSVVGKTWQAWYILKGESVPRPLETTTEAHLLIRVPANVQVIAVSEEPVGGSLVPTTIRAIATL